MPKMPLNTLEHSRQQLTKLIRLRRNQEMETSLFRDLTYSFSVLLQYWKLEKDIEIEKRLEAIENSLELKK